MIRTIGLLGYAGVQARHIAKLMSPKSEVLEDEILVCGGQYVLMYDTSPEVSKGESMVELTFNLEQGDNQKKVMRDIHNVVEDIFSSKGVGILSIEDLLYELNVVCKTETTNPYLKTVKALWSKMKEQDLKKLWEYCSKEYSEADLEDLYILRKGEGIVSEVYNAIYVAVKYALIRNLSSSKHFSFINKFDVRNNCITLTATLPTEKLDTIFKAVRNARYGHVAFVDNLEVVKVTNNGDSDLRYLYTTYPYGTPKYLNVVNECNYIIYCETYDHLRDIEGTEAALRLEESNTMIPDSKVGFFLIKDYISKISPSTLDELIQTGFSKTIETFSTGDDLVWVGSEEDEMGIGLPVTTNYFHSNESKEDVKANLDVDEILELQGTPEITEESGAEDFDIPASTLLGEVDRVGVGGFKDPKVKGFEEDLNDFQIVETASKAINSHLELNYPTAEVNQRTYYIVSTEDFNVSQIGNDFIENIEEAVKQVDLKSTLLDEVQAQKGVEDVKKILVDTRENYMNSMVLEESQLVDKNSVIEDTEALYRKECVDLLLSGTCQKFFTALVRAVNGAEIDLQLPPDLHDSILKEYKIDMILSIYNLTMQDAYKKWVANLGEDLYNNNIPNKNVFKKLLNEVIC